MDYDNWKQEVPPEYTNECSFCGEPCTGKYCSKECYDAELKD